MARAARCSRNGGDLDDALGLDEAALAVLGEGRFRRAWHAHNSSTSQVRDESIERADGLDGGAAKRIIIIVFVSIFPIMNTFVITLFIFVLVISLVILMLVAPLQKITTATVMQTVMIMVALLIVLLIAIVRITMNTIINIRLLISSSES